MFLKKFSVWLLITLFVSAQSVSAAQEKISSPDFDQLPIAFIPNTDSESTVRFQAAGIGGTLFFTPSSVVFSLPEAPGSTSSIPVQLQFEDANPATSIN